MNDHYRTIDDAISMVERITGDNPPPLDSWDPKDWMNLLYQVSRVRTLEARIDEILRKFNDCRKDRAAELRLFDEVIQAVTVSFESIRGAGVAIQEMADLALKHMNNMKREER